MKEVKFNYRESTEHVTEHWGCCCECVFHFKVNNHCGSGERESDCICSQELGFYVCTVLGDIDNTDRSNLSGEHGLCECFQKRNLAIPTDSE